MKKWFKQAWQAIPMEIPIFLAIILLGVALFLNPSDFINMAWYALVALTAVYAYATVKVVIENKKAINEMRQTRLDAVKPALSLQPEDFTFGGDFSTLYLMNSGGVAKDVKLDIKVTNPDSEQFLYIPTINKEHKVFLQINNKVNNAGGFVRVLINYKDSYNQELSEILSLDFSDLNKEGRKIIGQNSELRDIIRKLEYIERKIK
jgi:hypothetical protein